MKTSFALLALVIVALPACAQTSRAENITFPADGRVVNVKEAPYEAKGDGKTDDTAAIQKALDDHAARGAILYLPNGTYLLSSTLNWPKGRGEGGFMKDTCLQGQNETGVVIRLKDKADGFGDAAKPKPLIFTGRPPAQRFRNSIRNLTVDTGQGNPGAVGISYYSNNEGNLRNVTIRAGEDGQAPGAIGLDMSLDEVGPQLVSGVTVIGFEIGIRTGASVNSITLEHITLRGQREIGFLNRNNLVFVRGLQSRNRVTAVKNQNSGAVMTLLDSDLQGEGAASTVPAIINESAQALLFARNIKTSGYAQALQASGGKTLPLGTISEWVSHAPVALFPNTALKTLDLPILDTPDIPFDDPKTWVSPLQFGGTADDAEDDTVAIQKAIDSGATTVYLPRGEKYKNKKNWDASYFISDTIVIRGNVRRIIGLEARLEPTKAFAAQSEKPMFRVGEGTGPVLIERLALGYAKFNNPVLINATKRTVIVKDFSGMDSMQITGGGDVFAEDVVGRNWLITGGSRLWGRQVNLEGGAMKLLNDGGQVWILGLKTECSGPMILTKGGGRTEVLGALFYSCVKQAATRGLFFVENGQFSLAGAGENTFSRDWAANEVLNETRGGETRSLLKDEMPRRGAASMFGLISTLSAPAKGAAPLAPQITKTAATATTLTLQLRSDDPGGDLAGFRVLRNGQPVGHYSPGEWRDSGLKPGTEYVYGIEAYNSSNQRSKPVEFKASTVLDTVAPTMPPDLRAGRVIDRRAQIQWNSSKDEIGVTGYEVKRLDAAGKEEWAKKTVSTQFADAAVTPGAVVTYQVVAIDAAGNISEPARLRLTIPIGPPQDALVELEKPSAKHKDAQTSWFLSNLYNNVWATYKGVELGRAKPFEKMTLFYSTPDERAGAEVDVFLDATVVNDKAVEGTKLGTFVLAGTGGWEKMTPLTIPIKIDQPGPHDITIRVRRANSPFGNAQGNLDKLTFTYNGG